MACWFYYSKNASCLITPLLLILKYIGLFLKENNILRCWGCLFPLNLIGVFTLYLLLKLPFSHEVALHVCKSTIRSSMEHCCNIRAGVHRYYLDMLDKMHKWVSLSHGWNVAKKVFSIGIALLDIHLNWLDWVRLLIGDLLVHSVRLGIDWVLGSWKNILH